MKNTTINVKWNHEEIEYTGTITFETIESGQVHISAEDNRQHQIFESGDVDVETAEAILDEIKDRDYDITDYEIF